MNWHTNTTGLAPDRPRAAASVVIIEATRSLPALILDDEPAARAHFPGHVAVVVSELLRNAEDAGVSLDLRGLLIELEVVEHYAENGVVSRVAELCASAAGTPR